MLLRSGGTCSSRGLRSENERAALPFHLLRGLQAHTRMTPAPGVRDAARPRGTRGTADEGDIPHRRSFAAANERVRDDTRKALPSPAARTGTLRTASETEWILGYSAALGMTTLRRVVTFSRPKGFATRQSENMQQSQPPPRSH